MLGLKSVAGNFVAGQDHFHCSAVLPIAGPHGIIVAISSNDEGCAYLTSKMYALDVSEIDVEMIADTFSELANMTAGQVKSVLGIDYALGLPKVLDDQALPQQMDHGWHHFPISTGASPIVLSLSLELSTIEEYVES